jgi:hypothetical protein
MSLQVELLGSLPSAVVDLTFTFRGESYGATLEGTEAREGHCASRLALIDTAVRNPDGWFDVPLSDPRIDREVLRKALDIILREHFDDTLASNPLIVSP